MAKLVINDGSEKYDIANKHGVILGSFYLNPTDTAMLFRLKDARTKFAELKAGIPQDAEIEEQMKDLEEKIKNLFDELFGYSCGTEIFKITGPLSPLPSGKLFFEEVLENVSALIGDAADKRSKKLNKYLDGLN